MPAGGLAPGCAGAAAAGPSPEQCCCSHRKPLGLSACPTVCRQPTAACGPQVGLHLAVPGKRLQGAPLPTGKRLQYKLTGPPHTRAYPTLLACRACRGPAARPSCTAQQCDGCNEKPGDRMCQIRTWATMCSAPRVFGCTSQQLCGRGMESCAPARMGSLRFLLGLAKSTHNPTPKPGTLTLSTDRYMQA